MFNVKKMTVVYNETPSSIIAETTHPSEFLETFENALENLFPVAEVEVRGRRSHWTNVHSETSFDWNYESIVAPAEQADAINTLVEEAFQEALKACQDSYADEAYEEYETSRAWLGCPSERFMMGAN